MRHRQMNSPSVNRGVGAPICPTEFWVTLLFRIIIYSTLQVFSKSGVFRMNNWMFRYSRSILFPIAFANAPVISASSSLVTKRNLAHTCYRRSEGKTTLDEHIAKIARQGVQTPSEIYQLLVSQKVINDDSFQVCYINCFTVCKKYKN